MSRKQKSKTPQPQKGPKQTGKKTPQSAPAMKKLGKKIGSQNTPAQAKQTPKAGDKRKQDSSLAVQTPKKSSASHVVSTKGNKTPVKMPQTPQIIKTPGGKKTLQTKTPASSVKAKKTTQKAASDDDDDDDDDDEDIDFENIDFDDSEDDDDDESLEENMDDDDDDDDESEGIKKDTEKVKKGLKAADVANMSDEDEDDDDDDKDPANTMNLSDSEDEDNDKDTDDDEDDDDDDDEDADESDLHSSEAILKNVQMIRKASQKLTAAGGKQKSQAVEKKAEQPSAANKKQEKKEKSGQKQQNQPETSKSKQKTENKAQKQPQPSANKLKKKGDQAADVVAPDASGDAKRKEDRDKCTLFVKNLSSKIITKDLKELSKDIKDVRLRIKIHGKKPNRTKSGYAFIEFSSEAQADKHFKLLQGKTVKGSELLVDYVGQKSNFLASNPKTESVDPDPLRLYITGFGSDVKDQDLYKLFPKAQDIVVPVKKSDSTALGYAFASFATPEQCKAAHEKGQGSKVNSCSLVVLYAKKRIAGEEKKKKKNKKKKKSKAKENAKKKEKAEPPAKKAKVEIEEEEEDDDDDDDDEDLDSEGDGGSDLEGADVMDGDDDSEEDDDEDDDDDDE